MTDVLIRDMPDDVIAAVDAMSRAWRWRPGWSTSRPWRGCLQAGMPVCGRTDWARA